MEYTNMIIVQWYFAYIEKYKKPIEKYLNQ